MMIKDGKENAVIKVEDKGAYFFWNWENNFRLIYKAIAINFTKKKKLSLIHDLQIIFN